MLGLHGTEQSKCNHVITVGFKGLNGSNTEQHSLHPKHSYRKCNTLLCFLSQFLKNFSFLNTVSVLRGRQLLYMYTFTRVLSQCLLNYRSYINHFPILWNSVCTYRLIKYSSRQFTILYATFISKFCCICCIPSSGGALLFLLCLFCIEPCFQCDNMIC